MSNNVDPYKILGIAKTATNDELKRKYKELLLRFHPDHYSDKMEALYKTNLIIRAYKIIMKERENLKKLLSLAKNGYELEGKRLDLFLKYKDKSFISMFEQASDIYSIQLSKSHFSKAGIYIIVLHYQQLTSDLKTEYKQIVLPQKMVIKDSKKIVLKQHGDFSNEAYKTLVVHLNLK